MASVNKVILVGNLGRDPETRTFPSGDQVCNVTLATTDKWKDKQSGEMREATEWHRLVFNGRLAEIAAQYLRKGSQIYVEGQIRTRKYNDKDGVEKYATDIRVDQMHAGQPPGPGRSVGWRRRRRRLLAGRRRWWRRLFASAGGRAARAGAGTAPGAGQVVVGLRRHGRRHSVLIRFTPRGRRPLSSRERPFSSGQRRTSAMRYLQACWPGLKKLQSAGTPSCRQSPVSS